MNRKYIFSAFFALAMLLSAAFASQTFAQTVLVNYSFNDAIAGQTPCNPGTPVLATGVTSTLTTSTGTCTAPAGNATTASAFAQNAVGSALSISGFATGATQYFQVQLSNVAAYSNYQIYFQAGRSGTGAQNATLQYSIDGTNFTDFQTVPVTQTGTPVVLDAFNFNLSSITALNGQPTVYFRIVGSGGSATAGTFRIDNFQVQATSGTTAAGATVEGRVLTSRGKAVAGAKLILTDAQGNTRSVLSARNGSFVFADVEVGQTYILDINSRGYRFNEPTRVLTVNENLAGIDFIAY